MVGDLWNTIRHQSLPDSLTNDFPPPAGQFLRCRTGGDATGTRDIHRAAGYNGFSKKDTDTPHLVSINEA